MLMTRRLIAMLFTATVTTLVPFATAFEQPATRPADAPAVQVQTIPPVAPEPSTAPLEDQAREALGRRDYAAALPLLRRMADRYKSDPRKLKAVEEQIREAERMLSLGAFVGLPVNETRKPIPAPKPGEVANFDSIKDLGNFEYDAEIGGNIPGDIVALSGKKIRLRGFMIPMDQAEQITTFALVPDLFACCFGQPPQIQHTVVVKTPKGKAVGYFPDQIVVEGDLKVEEKREEGYIVSVFELSASSVKPVAN